MAGADKKNFIESGRKNRKPLPVTLINRDAIIIRPMQTLY